MKEFKVSGNNVNIFIVYKHDKEAKAVLSELFYERAKPSLDDYRTIGSYEDACEVLGIDKLDEESMNACGVDKHIIALIKLETVSRALWGANFEPKPDIKGSKTYWLPIFSLYKESTIAEFFTDPQRFSALHATIGSNENMVFGDLGASEMSSADILPAGFRLCQECRKKGEYFSMQFIELWSEYLAYNFTTGEKYAIG